jgi:hypothetical protein
LSLKTLFLLYLHYQAILKSNHIEHPLNKNSFNIVNLA